MAKKRGLLVRDNKPQVVEIKELQDMYNLIGCDLVDIVTRRIGDKIYDIICDDEGLLKANPQCTAFNSKGEPMLFGNLIVLGCAENDTRSLTDEEIEDLKKNFTMAIYPTDIKWVLNNVEYC